jgi:hypothetical protein
MIPWPQTFHRDISLEWEPFAGTCKGKLGSRSLMIARMM